MSKLFHSIQRFFRSLQWRLTSSYVLVTFATFAVIAALVTLLVITVEGASRSDIQGTFFWSKTAFQDNVPFLLDNPAQLQQFLDRTRNEGFISSDFKSYTIGESLAFANTVRGGEAPIFVLSPDLKLIASSPAAAPSALGKPVDFTSVLGWDISRILEEAQTGSKSYNLQSIQLTGGRYMVAFPLRETDEAPVSAIIIYALKPLPFSTPESLSNYAMYYLVILAASLLVSLPIGALFGWLASRGMRKRLLALSTAAASWSRGEFIEAAPDRRMDEIGELRQSLNRMAEELRNNLNTRAELARVAERNRLARDLHDTVKQQTYAARMQLSAARNLLKTAPEEAAVHLDAALQLNRESQQELRLIIDELRPPALDGKGLAEAVREYTGRWEDTSGIPLILSVSGDRHLPFELEQTLYRVMQEGLANVARHSQATQAALNLIMEEQAVILQVGDNGRGFDPQEVDSSSTGLAGMRQRLAEAGGTLEINSRPMLGTSLTIRVPIPQG